MVVINGSTAIESIFSGSRESRYVVVSHTSTAMVARTATAIIAFARHDGLGAEIKRAPADRCGVPGLGMTFQPLEISPKVGSVLVANISILFQGFVDDAFQF